MSDITTEVIKKGKNISLFLPPFSLDSVAQQLVKQKNQIFILKKYPFFSDISPSIDHQKKKKI
jgi:hypothetical protein